MIRVYGTLGPACADQGILTEMLRAGMTGIRLNLSHILLKDAAHELKLLREAEAETGIPSELLIDLQGPEVRIGKLCEPLELTDGSTVTMDVTIPVPQAVLAVLQPGQKLLLDDGKLLLKMETKTEATVIRGGILASRKSLAIEGVDLHLPPLTQEDLINLEQAAEFGVTAVMQPFVRGAEDLITLRNALDAAGGENIRIFAKIENRSGIAHLAELLSHCDEIIIARGDLGNAVTLLQLPAVQKEISAACREAGKPFLVVTQLLASMEQAQIPTRAEISDIFNAVQDGADSLMLTGETAVGAYPVDSIRWLRNAADIAEAYRNKKTR